MYAFRNHVVNVAIANYLEFSRSYTQSKAQQAIDEQVDV